MLLCSSVIVERYSDCYLVHLIFISKATTTVMSDFFILSCIGMCLMELEFMRVEPLCYLCYQLAVGIVIKTFFLDFYVLLHGHVRLSFQCHMSFPIIRNRLLRLR